MFYKYPEEFIVPVIYTKDLVFYRNDGYRNLASYGEEIIGENIENERLLLDEEKVERIFESIENTNVSEGRIGILNEPFQKNEISDNISSNDLEYKEFKEILNEIDNEYAKSESGIV